MNPRLARLQPYPFERLRQLFAGVQPPAALRHINLGIGKTMTIEGALTLFATFALTVPLEN